MNYFTAVAQRWPEAWSGRQRGMVLNRTTGYRALMRFLPVAYLSLGHDSVFPTGEFKAIFERVKVDDSDFTQRTTSPAVVANRSYTNDSCCT